MRLLDCFLRVFALTRVFLNQGGGDLAAFRAQIMRLIEEARVSARKVGISEEDFQRGLFPIIAWVDESIMCSELEEGEQWRKSPLQMELFRTWRAGVEFYSRLEELTADQAQIREVYYLALVAGFRGRYLEASDQPHIDWLKEQQLQALLKDRERLLLDGNRPLFPEAFPIVRPEPAGRGRGWALASLPIVPILGPLAIVAVLYASFALILSVTVHQILATLG